MAFEVIVITGPTATGKTELAAALASEHGGEVVSADSMQIYKYMDVGTAKPTESEMRGVRHHMLDIVPPWEGYSAARYVKEASSCVDDIIKRGKLPIIAGGTGLYIESLLSGREFSKKAHPDEIRILENRYDKIGGEEMLKELSEFDPDSAAKLHNNDKKRIIRAFGVYKATGMTISEHDAETKKTPPRYSAIKIALTFKDRAVLYGRIDKRVELMLEKGLENEVKALLKMGVAPESTAMQAIGYKEMAKAVKGDCGYDEAVEKIKAESRRYAKRQLSWFRRDNGIKWLYWDKTPDLDLGLAFSTAFLKNS